MHLIAALLAALVIWLSVFTSTADTGVVVHERQHIKKRPSPRQVRHRHRQQQRLKVIRAAQRLLGVPYVFGGTGRGGVDCSGLTRYAYAAVERHLPHLAAAQQRMGRYISERNLRPGDLLFYNDGGHVALYVGKGQMISASSVSGRVVRTSVRSGYDEARRLIG